MKALSKNLFFGFLVFGLLGLGSVSTLSSQAVGCIWTISKCANASALTLAPGEPFVVNYSIVVNVAAGSVCTPWPVDYAEVYDPFMVSPLNPTGLVGTVKYGIDNLPKTLNYSRILSFETCGDYLVENTATLCTGASSTWSIPVHVPCGGCTLTPGYWKTHSLLGPAPYDNTWALLSNGADTLFFLSGQSWHDVFWTPPSGGSAYYILAHAYMAAYLNLLNGAATLPEVDSAIAWAQGFFGTYTPADSFSKSFRNTIISYASLLDNYNNGVIGPGHCSE